MLPLSFDENGSLKSLFLSCSGYYGDGTPLSNPNSSYFHNFFESFIQRSSTEDQHRSRRYDRQPHLTLTQLHRVSIAEGKREFDVDRRNIHSTEVLLDHDYSSPLQHLRHLL